jgi:hypothetical protein
MLWSLDDEEIRILRDCAARLPPKRRKAFLADFAREMTKYPEHGPGLTSRVARSVVRSHQAQSGRLGSANVTTARLSAEALFRQDLR